MESGLVRLEDAADGQHGMAVTIKLKPDLFWGDGVPVTAKDPAFTWRVGSSAKVGFTNPYFWTRVTGVDVVDDHTAVMHIKERINSYDQWGALLPEHVEGPIWAKLADASAYRNVTTYNRAPTTSGLYNGPYLITGYQSGQQIVLEPNPHWSGKRPGFKRIVIKIIEDTAALQANVLAGDVDLAAADAGALDVAQVIALQKQKPDRFQYIFQPTAFYGLVVLNIEHPALADVRVRRALLMAIDRQTIVDELYGGFAQVAATFISPRSPYICLPYAAIATNQPRPEVSWRRPDGGPVGTASAATPAANGSRSSSRSLRVIASRSWSSRYSGTSSRQSASRPRSRITRRGCCTARR
jgi:peptide/nickel transport system substrate-binding protein